MSDEKGKAPARALTIRVGDETITDVKDYVLLVRGHDEGFSTRASNKHWAHGAMTNAVVEIEHSNIDEAGHECGEDCEGGKDE